MNFPTRSTVTVVANKVVMYVCTTAKLGVFLFHSHLGHYFFKAKYSVHLRATKI